MTEILEKEVEYLSAQDKAEAILYGAAEPKFATDHDLADYNEIADKYGVEPVAAAAPAAFIEPPPPVMQSYAPPTVERPPLKTNFGRYISPDDTIAADKLPKYNRPFAPAPVEKIAEETVVMRDVDAEMDAEDIVEKEYVWKFKPKTMVAVACVTVILALLATLLIINAVNIAKANVELAQLENGYNTAVGDYQNASDAAQLAKQNALNEIGANGPTVLPSGTLPTEYDQYREPVDLESSTNVFDAICEFLSKIF